MTRILLVRNAEDQYRPAFVRSLLHHGYRVAQARGLKEAKSALLPGCTIDLVLVDAALMQPKRVPLAQQVLALLTRRNLLPAGDLTGVGMPHDGHRESA